VCPQEQIGQTTLEMRRGRPVACGASGHQAALQFQ
jgi:hypothetical protein